MPTGRASLYAANLNKLSGLDAAPQNIGPLAATAAELNDQRLR